MPDDKPSEARLRLLWSHLERQMARRLPLSSEQDEDPQDLIARSKLILKETAGASSTRLFRPMALPDG